MSVEYCVGRMPTSLRCWKDTYVPIPRGVAPVSPALAVSVMAKKSLQPSPICSRSIGIVFVGGFSQFERQPDWEGPPVSRLLQPWAYSCAITPLSRSESRSLNRLLADAVAGRFARRSAPSASETPSAGIATNGARTPDPRVMALPPLLFWTIAAIAHASWTFSTFVENSHEPRRTIAILRDG